MDFAKLAAAIAEREPTAAPHEIAQIAMLMLQNIDPCDLADPIESLPKTIADVKLRMKAASDQHAAMAEEIQTLACSDPRKYSSDQVWTLIRAIKVQSQMLELYACDKLSPIN